MPAVSVSMVCESTTANVTAALRESLAGSGSGGGNGSCSAAANAATGNTSEAAIATGISSAALITNGSNGHGTDIDDNDSLQSKLVASAKRVLLSKIDYEEVDSYGQSVLDTLKSKYIVLKANETNSTTNGSNGNGNGCTTSTENGRSLSATNCNNGNTYGNGSSSGNSNTHNAANTVNGNSTADCNGNATHTATVGSSKCVNAVAASTSSSASNVSNFPNNHNNSNNSANTPNRRPNSHELPTPKRILFPRENVRIGWKNGTRKWQIGVGMMNVGNTCYLNSALQALFHVPSLANWLASETAHMERCDDGGEAGCIICAMCKTLLNAQTHLAPIRPYSVYSKLRIICKHLIMGRQEDAHEFLRYLVEAMEKSYLSRFNNYKELDQYSKETTPLNQILGGYLKSAVRCLSCNHVSVTFQHFQDLLLDIRKADTVEEALDVYFSRERLEDMGYKCESCKKKVSATKQFTLERAPIALCIQLKRFSMMGSKLSKQIAIRPRLDLSKYLTRKSSTEQYTYKLVSMITHLGASQHCGHYTAIGLTESGAYYNFDDSCVRPISVQNVCNTNAYIIFYELDNAPVTQPRSISQNCTPSSSNHLKENNSNNSNGNGYQTKTNGFSLNVKNSNNDGSNGRLQPLSSLQDQRLIGPQLPPGGLQNSNSSSNGIKLKNIISNCTPSTNHTGATGVNAPGNSGGNNPKILIHFKNGPTNARPSNSSTTATTTTTASSINSTGSLENSCTTATNLLNGATNGAARFQDLPNAKTKLDYSPTLDSPASPLFKVSILDENSCNSEPEDGVSSTTDGYSECTVLEVEASSLPSMPNLFDEDDKSKEHCPELHATFSDNSNSNKCNNNNNKTNSLVPYDLESDDDNNIWNITTTKRQENQSPAFSEKTETVNNFNNINNNTLKRSSSASLLENNTKDDNDSNDYIKTKKCNSFHSSPHISHSPHIDAAIIRNSSPQSKAKQKTDNPIDEIFNNNHNKLSNRKSPQSPTQLTLPLSQMPSSPLKIAYDDCSNDEKYEPNVTPPSTPHRRSYSITPPSPPLIHSKTGLWQVSDIHAADKTKVNTVHSPKKSNDLSPVSTTSTTPPSSLTPPRTWINPFSTKSSSEAKTTATTTTTTTQNSRPSEKRSTVGNGYKSSSDSTEDLKTASSSTNSTAVTELLQQSHRGYGAPVLTWNGEQPHIEKELKTEARDQRQQDIDIEEENDMDRGRQKKVKQHVTKDTNFERTPGYNPFQEQDNQRCRWKSNGNNNVNSNSHSNSNNSSNNTSNSSNPYRYYSSNYRQQPYQRNKSKFQRYNYNKYQRPQQQQNNNNSYSSNGQNSNNNSNSSYTSRRET